MIKRILIFSVLCMMICPFASARSQRDEIPNFEKDSVVILNNELRKLRDDLNSLGKIFSYQSDLIADDATVSLPDATYGFVTVSVNAECGTWVVESDGTCTKVVGTTNTADTDLDTDLCVYDGGTKGIVKNRLGVNGEIVISYNYN